MLHDSLSPSAIHCDETTNPSCHKRIFLTPLLFRALSALTNISFWRVLYSISFFFSDGAWACIGVISVDRRLCGWEKQDVEFWIPPRKSQSVFLGVFSGHFRSMAFEGELDFLVCHSRFRLPGPSSDWISPACLRACLLRTSNEKSVRWSLVSYYGRERRRHAQVFLCVY